MKLLTCPKCYGDSRETLDVFIREVIPGMRDKESRYVECTCGIRFEPSEDTDTFDKIATLWNTRP